MIEKLLYIANNYGDFRLKIVFKQKLFDHVKIISVTMYSIIFENSYFRRRLTIENFLVQIRLHLLDGCHDFAPNTYDTSHLKQIAKTEGQTLIF